MPAETPKEAVGTDVLLFRHNTLARLLVNVGIVFVFGAFFLRFRHALGV